MYEFTESHPATNSSESQKTPNGCEGGGFIRFN